MRWEDIAAALGSAVPAQAATAPRAPAGAKSRSFVAGASTAGGAPVELWTGNERPWQRWSFA